MDFNEIKNTADKYLMPTYGHFPIALTGGKNASLTASDGRVVIDFTSGIGVNIFGVNDDGWKKAVIGQIDKIQHTFAVSVVARPSCGFVTLTLPSSVTLMANSTGSQLMLSHTVSTRFSIKSGE